MSTHNIYVFMEKQEKLSQNYHQLLLLNNSSDNIIEGKLHKNEEIWTWQYEQGRSEKKKKNGEKNYLAILDCKKSIHQWSRMV